MIRTLTRFELGNILCGLKAHPNPKYWLEQHSITANIAESVLFLARGDIENKVVYDLGCGTGRFAIGAALLGARRVCGIDVDEEVLDVARKNAQLVQRKWKLPAAKRIRWECQDVETVKEKCDTVIQFPPFEKDAAFFRKALSVADNVYSLHRGSSKRKKMLLSICKDSDAKIVGVERFKYHILWEEGQESGYLLFLVKAKK